MTTIGDNLKKLSKEDLISNLEITAQDDNNRYYMLAQLMFKFCLSDQEIVMISDYQNIKTLRIDQKYLKLSGTLRLKDACQYPNLIQHHIVDAVTQIVMQFNTDKFSDQLNLYHNILTHGYSIDNLIWWALYQHQHHYSITDMIEYFNFDRQLYTAALKFYGLPQVIFLPLNGRKQLVKELAEKYRDNTQFRKYIDILSSDITENYQHLTYRDVARIYQWPTEIYKDVLRQLLTKDQLIHIAAMSGINKSVKTNLHRYGVEFPLQSQEIMKRNEQTVLKRYGVKSVLQNKQICSKVVKSRNQSIKTNREIQTRLKHTGQINGAHSFRKCLGIAYQLAAKLNYEYARNLQQLINQSQDIENALKLRQKYTKQPQKLFEFLSLGCDQLIMWPNTVFDDSNLLSNLQISKTMMKEYGQQHDSKIKLDDIQLNLSKDEYRLYEKIMSLPKEIRPVFITGDRQQITYYYKGQRRHYELDFYFPDLRLAIEINPSRYHSLNKYSLGDIQNIDNLAHRRDYHFDKYQRAKHDNIRLIQLFQYDLAPAKFDLTWHKIKSLLTNQVSVSQFNIMTLNEYLRISNQTIQEFNKQTLVATTTGHNNLKYVAYTDNSLLVATINEHNDRLEITDINANNLSNVNVVLTALTTKLFNDHQNINQVLVNTDNDWDISLQQPFNLVDSNLKQIYISQNIVDGMNSMFSKSLFDNAREANSEINQDRRLKNLAVFDKNTPNDEIEQYIETELTHKGYAKEFKEENGRDIQSPDDVLNTHKGYDRVFTAGSSKWVAKRKDFIK